MQIRPLRTSFKSLLRVESRAWLTEPGGKFSAVFCSRKVVHGEPYERAVSEFSPYTQTKARDDDAPRGGPGRHRESEAGQASVVYLRQQPLGGKRLADNRRDAGILTCRRGFIRQLYKYTVCAALPRMMIKPPLR